MTTSIDQFLTTRYGDQSGYCCIGYIDGDPRFAQLTQEWYTWPRQRHAVTTRLVQLAERGLNIYAARCLFTETKRTYTAALPSPWLWIDDVSIDTDCTELIETSPTNCQGWLKLDQAIPAQEAHTLQLRWRLAVGGDGCSSDAVHMTRIPGGYNTKQHQRFQVRVADQRETVHQIDTLPWPPLPAETVIALNIPTIEAHHSDYAPLLRENGIPRRFKPRSFGYQLLTGTIQLTNRQGTCDHSTPRFALAKSCAYARYTPEDAAAILWHHTPPNWLEAKGATWHHTDITRCIAKSYAAVRQHLAQNGDTWHARPLTAREHAYSTDQAMPTALPTTQRKSRARRDRPTRLTEDDLLHYWHTRCEGASQQRFYRRTEVAQALKVSLSTLDRLIRRLKDAGRITITTPRRQQSIVTIQPESADSGPVNIPVEHPQTTADEVLSDESPLPQPEAIDADENPYRGTHSPDSDTLPVAEADPELAALVAQAQAGQHPEPRTTVATAVREVFAVYGTTTRLTLKKIRWYLSENYPNQSQAWPTEALTFWIQSVRRERNWQKQVDALRTMTYDGVVKLQKTIDRIQKRALQGQREPRYSWACALSSYVTAELARREAMNLRASPPRQREHVEACIEAVEQDRATELQREQVMVCAVATRLRQRRMAQVAAPVVEVKPAADDPSGPVQIPKLPDGWSWMFVPSHHLHRAHQPDRDLKTRFYHTHELCTITRDIRRLERQPGTG